MGSVKNYIPQKDIDLIYNSAKIIASPYDYKLSERALMYSSEYVTCYFNIFNKSNHTEEYLCNALGLSRLSYLDINPNIKVEASLTAETIVFTNAYLWHCEKHLGTAGNFIKYNNLVIDSDCLIDDLSYLTARISDLKDKNYLKALEVWHLLGTGASSLIPNLFYLTTEYYNKPLDELENIKFAEEAIGAELSPLLENCRYYDNDSDTLTTNRLYTAAMVPLNLIAKKGYCATGYVAYVSKFKDVGNWFYKLGLVYSIVYGAELLYCFNNIKDDTLKAALEELMFVNYETDSFCSKFLYTFDSTGHVEINPNIVACFDSDNAVRFENIRNLLSTVLSEPDFNDTVFPKLKYYGLPIFFGKMVINMHAYAYQVCRIKHVTLLYNKAKEAGVINKELFTDIAEGSNELSGGCLTSDADDDSMSNELLDLSTFIDGPKELSETESVAKEKEVHKKRKPTPSALNAADMLKKDLYESRYEFDITHVHHDNRDSDAYNSIATSIKLITHELTRQIKDIKTYNTGGKQNGLLVGKLDKKNLWKYKTDPHIFYNNNYKLKEMDLAFGCILDESGSMSGEKIKNGRIVMIMLHEVLSSLGINHSIIGHTSHNMYQSKIYKYYQFKEESHYSLNKPYGLVRADNRSGNCDSGALFYMQSVMKGVRNKDKIVIIFSDGQPTECTDLDLTNQVKAMEKEGIHVIGVGINFESIREYYPDNANGKNLKEMVNIVVSILKRYVLEKKED